MPKVTDRRIDKARELIKRLEKGPSTSFDVFLFERPTDAEINRQYKLWADSWIIPIVKELVPELKKRGANGKKE